MPGINPLLHAFNRGEVSKIALSRVDVDRIRLSAEEQINWMPRKLGPMTMRPGLAYLGALPGDGRILSFVSSLTNKALLEFTNAAMRVWVDDAVLTRVAVDTAVNQPLFAATGNWVVSTTGGASSSITGGELVMSAEPLGSKAFGKQTVTCPSSGGNQAKEHALRIDVTRGPVQLRVGTTGGAEDLIRETSLGTGLHSLAFTPNAANIFIEFSTTLPRQCKVNECSIESQTGSTQAAGAVVLTTPYTTAYLDLLRSAISADVMFIACAGLQQRRVERRGQRSWSITLYQADDGPFLPLPTANVQLTPSGTVGNVTLSSDKPFFRASHVGAIFRLFQTSNTVTQSISAANTFSDPIRISGLKTVRRPKTSGSTKKTIKSLNGGVGDGAGDGETPNMSRAQGLEAEQRDAKKNKDTMAGTRKFNFAITGKFNGTIELQRSFDGPDVGYQTFQTFTKATASFAIHDDYDNSVVWYRAGFPAGKYTSGSASITLKYPHGAGMGIARVTGFNSSTSVNVEVLNTLQSREATRDWLEGSWSDRQGWPSSVGFHGGRLWWFGNDTSFGSVSDAYDSFDYEMEGEAEPVIRSIGEGPVQNINSMVPLRWPVLFAAMSELRMKASSLEEPITSTNFGIADVSTQGSANVQALKVDGRAIFIHRSSRKVFQVLFLVEQQDYVSADLSALHPDMGSAYNFTRMAVQRQPETFVHVVRADGTACVLMYEPGGGDDPLEGMAWWRVVTGTASNGVPSDGFIRDVAVLPGEAEDQVYCVVQRTVNSSTVYYLEKFAKLSECIGGTTTKLADSHIVYSGSGVTTITGLSHLEGKTVVVWGNGKDLGTKVVASGQITGLSESVTNALVGLGYDATYKSSKLAYGAAKGTALAQKKRISKIGLVLLNTHYQGLRYGQDFTTMDNLPLVKGGTDTAADTVHADFDEPMIELNGEWTTDARLCLKGSAPRPATVCAVVIGLETHDKPEPQVDAENPADDRRRR